MKVINHLLYGNDGKQVTFRRSPNISKGILKQDYCVIHYTGSSSAESAIGWMVDPTSKVSAHLHIDRLGNVVQLVKFDNIAWHAGASFWNGITGLNSYSIGIELSNSSTQEYTQVQMDALVEVCRALNAAYPIKEYVGHDQIATPKGRKVDPGKQFNWSWFRSKIKTQSEPGTASQFETTATGLNLRTGAGTAFGSVSVLPKGTKVGEISRSGEWSQVYVCGSNLTGYVSNKFLAPIK